VGVAEKPTKTGASTMVRQEPSGRKKIVYIEVDAEKCDGCGSCVDICPNEVFEIQDDICVPVNPDDCLECESCVAECPNEAITLSE
jgi:NAD-dependent dihydropyrimidine dehydrogenase PreA subunit